MNIVFLDGRLTNDPEVRFTKTGIKWVSFRMAHNTYYKQGDEVKKDTVFIKVETPFRRLADKIEQLKKGDFVVVQGSLMQDEYIDKAGNKKTITFIRAKEVIPGTPLKARDVEPFSNPEDWHITGTPDLESEEKTDVEIITPADDYKDDDVPF